LRIVMLEPLDNGLMATTLRYAYEVRDAKPYFEDIPGSEVAGRDDRVGRAHPGH
jgi:DNA end-binding protein Ku